MKETAIQDVVDQAPDGTGGGNNTTGDSSNLPRMEHPELAKEPIITQVRRRHKKDKQRELMIAGLQVRQQQGESIAYLLNSLPHGSVIQVESNTRLIVAQPIRRLQLSIYQNALGNVQIASVTSQDGIVPPNVGRGQILVTVNGKAVKSVDQAVQLLSVPEKLLIVMAEAALDRKDRRKRKGTARVVDSVLIEQDCRPQASAGAVLHRGQSRRRSSSRRKRRERRGSAGSHNSARSASSRSQSGRRKSSGSAEATTPLRDRDKIIPTIRDGDSSTIRRNSSSSSISSSNNNMGDDSREKIWVAKASPEDAASIQGSNTSTQPATDESDEQLSVSRISNADDEEERRGNNGNKDSSKDSKISAAASLMINDTMDTANTTMLSYDEVENDFEVHSPRMISPSSSVVGSPIPAARSPGMMVATRFVTPAPRLSQSQPSLADISKIASYDEGDNDLPFLFQSTSQESQDEHTLLESKAGIGAARREDVSRELPSVLAKLEKHLDETMMELAFVLIEMEDIQSKKEEDSMTSLQLEAIEKDLRQKVFCILEARQAALQQQDQQDSKPGAQQSLLLPTIEEQPKKAVAQFDLKQPPSPPPKFSLAPSKKMHDLERQLEEMQTANQALRKELARKDSQLEEFVRAEDGKKQNNPTGSIPCQ